MSARTIANLPTFPSGGPLLPVPRNGVRFCAANHRVGLFSAGDTGWTYSRVMVHLPDLDPIPARVTLVWQWEDGRWQVIHSHASTGN